MAVPQIYSASVEDVGVPIKKRSRAKQVKTPPKSSESVTVPEGEKSSSEASETPVVKRARKTPVKKVSEPIPKAAEEVVQPPVPSDKKAKVPRKRVKKDVEQESNSTESIGKELEKCFTEEKEASEPKEKKVKTPPPMVDDTTPPAWFRSYIQGVRAEEALIAESKVSKKATKAAANEEAQAKWSQPVVRDRVTKSIDSHMQKMYSSIFPNRRF